jgi:hypothetical protein
MITIITNSPASDLRLFPSFSFSHPYTDRRFAPLIPKMENRGPDDQLVMHVPAGPAPTERLIGSYSHALLIAPILPRVPENGESRT